MVSTWDLGGVIREEVERSTINQPCAGKTKNFESPQLHGPNCLLEL